MLWIGGGVKYQYDFLEKENSKIWISFVGGNGTYSNSKELLKYRAEELAKELDMAKYWNAIDIHKPNPLLANGQKAFLEKYFLPKLDKKNYICEFACASGGWSEFVSPYVAHVDGFDGSERMIATAKKNAVLKKLDNISYYSMDARQIHFERQYDHFIMLGLLTCIDDEESVEKIVCAASESLKAGGYFVAGDSLNLSEPEKIYYNNLTQNRNYSAVYHPKKFYEDVFARNGLEIVQEESVLLSHSRPIKIENFAYLLKKK